MKQIAGLAGIALLAAACASAPTNYESAGRLGTTVNVIDCAAAAITDDGFMIIDRSDAAGQLQATHPAGADDSDDPAPWLKVNVVETDATHFVIRVETSQDDTAEASAREIMEECS